MVTSVSVAPLVMTFYLGMIIFCGVGIYTIFLIINQVFISNPMPGWTSVMVSVWLLGGIMIALIGAIGIYLAKIFAGTKQRPYTIVRQVYRHGGSQLPTPDSGASR